ncbi:unnamed protein product [Porites evermanni]|uniref:Uncharacterized protein n=1 Tax=Porites evermanni TaxID=104178 RepID=A0ABN8ST82_9CNID|nr:unnamed protein product [Porites evermanni]
MSAIISAVFKATIGLIVDKGRDVAAERLKEGDVADQKFRSLIVRDLKEIHHKLDALSQKDLNAAVDFFETGLGCLYKAVDIMRRADISLGAAKVSERNEEDYFKQITLPSDTDPEKAIVLADGIRNMQLNELDETTKSLLSNAQKKFRLAVENATHACNNEALSTFDRITAIRYRVMAAMLQSAAETARTTGDLKSTLQKALPECEQCLKKLNSLPAVQNSFKPELSKGLLNIRGRFGKDERMQIISTVCQVNRVIYDAMQTVGKEVHVLVWPYVDIGEDQVDPLRDERVLQVLERVNMEHCCITAQVRWSFNVACSTEFWHMATNTLGQFLIAEHQTETVHVYNNNGIFQYSFNPQTFRRDNITQIKIADLVTEDVSEKIYLLVEMFRESRSYLDGDNCEVQVFNKTPYPLRRYKFPAKIGHRLIVSGSKLAILGSWEARVYDQNGELDRSFEFFKRGGDKELADCTATYEGRILIMHNKGGYSDYHCVHVFTMEGQEIAKFKSGLGLKLDYMRFSPRSAGEHVVIGGYNKEDEIITVEINTVDGKFERRILLRYNEPKLGLVRITVTVEGHIALSFYSHADRHGKVAVFKN